MNDKTFSNRFIAVMVAYIIIIKPFLFNWVASVYSYQG